MWKGSRQMIAIRCPVPICRVRLVSIIVVIGEKRVGHKIGMLFHNSPVKLMLSIRSVLLGEKADRSFPLEMDDPLETKKLKVAEEMSKCPHAVMA
jgi:hypothetical protein